MVRKTPLLRFPMVEEAMSGIQIQPYVHDVIVTVRHGRHICCFNIFVKNHRLLPFNQTILALIPGRQWNGDILALKVGKSVPGVVNMSQYDALLADFAVKEWVTSNMLLPYPVSWPIEIGLFALHDREGDWQFPEIWSSHCNSDDRNVYFYHYSCNLS